MKALDKFILAEGTCCKCTLNKGDWFNAHKQHQSDFFLVYRHTLLTVPHTKISEVNYAHYADYEYYGASVHVASSRLKNVKSVYRD